MFIRTFFIQFRLGYVLLFNPILISSSRIFFILLFRLEVLEVLIFDLRTFSKVVG